MPSKFTIIRYISTGKPGRAEVTVDFQGRSVTRHIRNGVGKHPDDTIPAFHARLEERLADNISLRAQKVAAQGLLTKTTLPKGLTPAQATDLSAKLQREISELDATKPIIEMALANARKEDPIMVSYM